MLTIQKQFWFRKEGGENNSMINHFWTTTYFKLDKWGKIIVFDIWTKFQIWISVHNFAFDMMYVRLFISNPTMELQSGSISISSRDVGNGWAGWEIAHPGFGRSVNTISTRWSRLEPPSLLLAHPGLGSFLRHWVAWKMIPFSILLLFKSPIHTKKSIEEISYPIVCINSICCGKYIFLRLLFCIDKKCPLTYNMRYL